MGTPDGNREFKKLSTCWPEGAEGLPHAVKSSVTVIRIRECFIRLDLKNRFTVGDSDCGLGRWGWPFVEEKFPFHWRGIAEALSNG